MLYFFRRMQRQTDNCLQIYHSGTLLAYPNNLQRPVNAYHALSEICQSKPNHVLRCQQTLTLAICSFHSDAGFGETEAVERNLRRKLF